MAGELYTPATRWHEHGDQVAVERVQDAEPALENAKALHNAGLHGDADLKHAMHIPAVMVEAYCNRHGISFHDWLTDPEHVKRMLNDPELAAFRIWKGRV